MSEPKENGSFSRQQWVFITLIFALGLTVLIVVALKNRPKTAETQAPIVKNQEEPVIAVLNGVNITLSEFELAKQYYTMGADPDAPELSNQLVLDRLVQQKLLARLAEDQGLIDQTYTRNRLQFAREQILAEDSATTLLKNAVSEADIEAYYDNERRIRGGRIQIKARQIVSPDEAAAREIIRRIDKGEAFSSLALAFSIDRASRESAGLALAFSIDRASRESAGDLGFLDRDMMDPILSEAIFAADDGDRIGPLKTEQGWHVIEVLTRRKTPVPSLEDRRDNIRALLQAKALETRLADLLKSADLKIVENPVD